MGWYSRARNAVTGTAKSIAAPIAIGLPSMMIGSGMAAVGGLAGMIGMGGGLPQPGGGGTTVNNYGSQDSGGYQQNLAGLMQMTGQQPPVMTSPTSIGGGGLI